MLKIRFCPKSDLCEAPGYGSTLLVHLGAPHHLHPPLKQHQGRELLGQRRRRHFVPARNERT